MMIVLHKHVPERNQHRFYALQVTHNLFGAWSLIRSWGRIGASGQQRIDCGTTPGKKPSRPAIACCKPNSAAATTSAPATLRQVIDKWPVTRYSGAKVSRTPTVWRVSGSRIGCSS